MTGALEARSAASRPVLYTRAFISICLVCLLAYSASFLIQPVLPLLVLERGGDATMVGIVIAAYSLPSVIVRPLTGRLADRAGARLVLLAGVAIIAIAGLAYLIPLLAAILVVRVVHGMGWAAFNTGNHVLLARLAPPERRGEASGIYNLMPGIGQMVLASAGLLLYEAAGLPAAFIAASLVGFTTLALVLFGPIPAGAPVEPLEGPHADEAWLERGAVLPMGLEFLFSLPVTLFVTFPPVFATSRGIPVADLAIYYPIYGATLVVVRILVRRFLDRAPRQAVIALGAALAIAGLGVSATADSVAILTLGAVLYAIAAACVQPTTLALAIDRSDPRRMGAAMATYTLGVQLALGGGAALWGVLIDTFGYPSPWLVAIALQGVLIGVLAIVRRQARAM